MQKSPVPSGGTLTALLDSVRTAFADRYLVERELGAGGMATVFLAKDVRHQRDVAIKVLRRELAAMLGAERCLREIEIVARLSDAQAAALDKLLPLAFAGYNRAARAKERVPLTITRTADTVRFWYRNPGSR